MSAGRVVVCVVMAFLELLFLPRKSNGNTRLPSLFINIDLHTHIARARMGYRVWATYMGAPIGTMRFYPVDPMDMVFPLLFLGENSKSQEVRYYAE